MKNQVTDIILALTKAVKVLQIYRINHPTFRNFYGSFYEKLADYLKKYNELSFQIEQFTILHSDRVIYEETEEDISIAFRLFGDGIRNIGFTEGLTSQELLLFLEIISQPSSEQSIALSLWECDFTHINFYIVEEEDEPLDYKIPDAPVENIDYEKKIREILDREKIDMDIPLTSDLNFYELKSLKTEILDDRRNSILALTIDVLIDFLNVERSQEIIDSLIELLQQCIENRDFYHARRIVYTLQEHTDINVIEKFENETTILGFTNLVNTSHNEIFNEFIDFIGFFSKKSIPYFLKMMAFVKRQDRLDALRQRFAHTAQGDPALIASFLKSANVTTVINAIAILGIMRLKEVVPHLQPLMYHAEPMVRAEIVSALKNVGEASMIIKFLDDPNSDVRIKALHALTQAEYPSIYSELLQRVKREDFLNLEFMEQKEYFKYLAANGDNNLTNELKEILFKKLSLFGSKRYRIMRKLAAIGLAHIYSEEALEILRQGAEDKNRDIKLACEMALRWK